MQFSWNLKYLRTENHAAFWWSMVRIINTESRACLGVTVSEACLVNAEFSGSGCKISFLSSAQCSEDCPLSRVVRSQARLAKYRGKPHNFAQIHPEWVNPEKKKKSLQPRASSQAFPLCLIDIQINKYHTNQEPHEYHWLSCVLILATRLLSYLVFPQHFFLL